MKLKPNQQQRLRIRTGGVVQKLSTTQFSPVNKNTVHGV